MRDGIYLVSRSLGAAGPAKTLVTGAYNNRGVVLTNLNSAIVIRDVDAWANSWGHFNFVQDDDAFYLAAYDYIKAYWYYVADLPMAVGENCPVNPNGCYSGEYGCYYFDPYHPLRPDLPPPNNQPVEWCDSYGLQITESWPSFPPSAIEVADHMLMQPDREERFSFDTPTPSGDIVSVAIWAEVRGSTKIRINTTYGTDLLNYRQFAWKSLVYTEKPGGGAWAWSDMASLTAGIYLYSPLDYYSSGHVEITGACRRLKAVITTTTGEITLWPTGDYGTNNNASLVAGNYLDDLATGDLLAATASVDMPILTATRTASAHANKYLTSDLSEIAPSFSLIDGITVTYAYRASTPSTDSYIRPYLEISGTKYYGSSNKLGNAYELLEYSETWTTNPDTGLAWEYDDYKTARFGVHVYSAANSSYTYLFKLYATTAYREREIEPAYTKIPADFESRTEAAQNPLTPDELVFYVDHPIPERVDVAYFQHGLIRFLGFVWSYSGSGSRYKITAKSYIAALDFRELPDISYSPMADRLDHVLSLNEILSADPPTRPLHSHIGKITTDDSEEFKRGQNPYNIPPVWHANSADDIIITHESSCGIMFIANSLVPVSNGDITGRVPGFGHLPADRAAFGLDKMLAQIETEYNFFTFYDGEEYDYPDIYYPVYDLLDATYHSDGFQVAGLRRLARHTGTTCTDAQYYQATDGSLYVAPWPGSQLILIDGAMDCFVDIDYNELGDYTLNEEVPFSGKVKSALDNVFALAGLEVTATPKLDGRIHLDARLANGRGTATEPLKKFYNKQNGKINIKTPEAPLPSAVVGYGVSELVSCDLQWQGTPLVEVIETDRTGQDLQDYLDAARDDDETVYVIKSDLNEDSMLRPLDWIWADDIPVRIQKIIENKNGVEIQAGKKVFRLSDQWGKWRGDLLQSDSSNVTSSKEVTGSGATLSTTFSVKAKEYRRGDWTARLLLSWNIITDGTEIEPTAVCKARVSLNSRKIGVYLLPGKSGSITIDISSQCSKSATSNTSNSLSIALIDRLTGATHHELTAKVEQRRAAAVLEEA